MQRTSPSGLKPGVAQILLRALKASPQLFLEALKVILPTSIFFFKFLEWWYSSSYTRQRLNGKKSDNSIPAIRAPRTRPPLHPDGVLGSEGEASLKPGTCPICKNMTANPTALPSGWVGDYKCLYDYVEKEGKCPVTRMPVAVGDLRKING